jgi:hypothetical protein
MLISESGRYGSFDGRPQDLNVHARMPKREGFLYKTRFLCILCNFTWHCGLFGILQVLEAIDT